MATVAPETPNLRPLRIGEILDVAIKVYTRNAGTLLRLTALVIAPVQALGLLVVLSTFPDSFIEPQPNPFVPDPNAPVPEFEEIGVLATGTLVLFVLSIVGSALATGACFKVVSDSYMGIASGWRESLRFALKKLLPLLWVTFLVLFITAGVVFASFFFAALLGAGIQNAAAFFVIIPAVLAAIALAVWLWVCYTVTTPVVLTEGHNGPSALSRSFNLVRGRWWPTFAVSALAALLAAIITSVLQSSVFFVSFTEVGQNGVVFQTLNSIAATIGAIVATPFQAAVFAIIYFDLRVRKEGLDLQLLAQRMGTHTEGVPQPALLPPAMPTAYVPPPGAQPVQRGPYETTPQYPAPPGHAPYAAPRPPQTNGMAIASLILGMLWLCWIGSIIALVMGYAAKRQIDASGGAQTGRGMAIAGIVLGWVGIAALVVTVLGAVSS
jgi:hypothetical protein